VNKQIIPGHPQQSPHKIINDVSPDDTPDNGKGSISFTF
jgi:hypothetical protein